MERDLQLEIENEYKAQITRFEENLDIIGNYEASLQPLMRRKTLNRVSNYIFAKLFLTIGLVIIFAAIFYFKLLTEIVDQGLSTFNSLKFTMIIADANVRFIIRTVLIFISVLMLIISALITVIRRKNRAIQEINIVTKDLKLKSLDMVNINRDRIKNFTRIRSERNN